MVQFLSIFTGLWAWCTSLFGVETGNNGASPALASELLSAFLIKDITSNVSEFTARNRDFYRNMAARHGSPNYTLHWHFMSASNAYLSDIHQNILFERAFYSLDPTRGHRGTIDKSFIVYSQWAEDWSEQLSFPRFLDVNETAGSIYFDDFSGKTRVMEGPEDAKVIYDPDTQKLILNFNMLTPSSDRQMLTQEVEVLTIDRNSSNPDVITDQIAAANTDKYEYFMAKTEPLMQFEHDNGHRESAEKNWVPIIIQGEVHYLYSLFPLRIIKCVADDATDKLNFNPDKDVTGAMKTCTVKFNGPVVGGSRQTGPVRSGTNWVEYSPGLYFSFARTRVSHKKCSGYALYRPNLVLLRFDVDKNTEEYANPRIIYISEPITKFDDEIFALYSKTGLSNGNKCDDRAIITPGSITRWIPKDGDGSDELDLVVGVNDDINVVVRLMGVDEAINNALIKEPSLKKCQKLAKKGTLMKKAQKSMTEFIEREIVPTKTK